MIEKSNLSLVMDVKDSQTIPFFIYNNLQHAIDESSVGGIILSFLPIEEFTERAGVNVIFIETFFNLININSLAPYEILARIESATGAYIGGRKEPKHLLFRFYQGASGAAFTQFVSSSIEGLSANEFQVSRGDVGIYTIDSALLPIDPSKYYNMQSASLFDELGMHIGYLGYNASSSAVFFAPTFFITDTSGVLSDNIISSGSEILVKLELIE